MARTLIVSLILALVSPLWGEQIGVTEFKYLNNNDNSMTIESGQAQDLLNVDIRPGGKSIKKRDGYGLYKDLGTDQGVHGGHHFFDSTGNDVQVWGSSRSLYGIVADATATQLVSSATLNATWDCADTQGYAYCVDSSRDAYIKTDGATKSWFTSPLGTMVEITPERSIVAGVSGSPNTLYFSESSVFTNFTVGIAETSPFTEVIASPGSKITHIRYGCGKILWWKDQSFGYLNGSTQFDLENKIVSDTIGTFDNTSAIDPGGNVWFRGQDGHIWKYDCSALTKESIEITPNIQTSGKRSSNYWTQTTQSDFQSGASSPTVSISFLTGSIVLSTGTTTYTTTADFSMGVTSNTEVFNGSVRISTSNANINNNSFETALDSNNDWTNSGSGSIQTSYAMDSCTVSPYDGSKMFLNPYTDISPVSYTVSVISYDGDTLASTSFTPGDNGCAWTQRTISGLSSHARKSAYINISPGSIRNNYFLLSGKDITFFTVTSKSSTRYTTLFDNFVDGRSTTNLGWYRSPSYDTGFNKSRITIISSYTSVNQSTDYTTVSYQTSTDNSSWGSVTEFDRYTSVSSILANRYVRFISTWTRVDNGGQNLSSTLDYLTFNVTSATGTYLGAIKNAPNLTGWDTFSSNNSLSGGSISYFVRASTGLFTVLSSTPQWASQTSGGVVSYSTGTYFQIKADFAVSYSTQTPEINDFTFNWYEGAASDQAYSEYFDNSIWFTVPYGSGISANNYIFKRDLINDGWTLYDFGTGGFAVQNNRLYFGQVSGDNLFKYGTGTSDNGSAITAYWKSKDFSGSDPFLQNTHDQADTIWKQNTNQTATVTYTLDTSSSTSYTVNLSSTTNSIINNRKNLSQRLGYTVNWKFGDSSATSSWELLGFRFTISPQPYRPSR